MPSDNVGSSTWQTLTNSHGVRLKVQDPQMYTEEEMCWIQQHHNKIEPSHTPKIVQRAMEVPMDALTAVLEKIHHWVYVQAHQEPVFQPPAWFQQDISRISEQFAREQERWQPTRK